MHFLKNHCITDNRLGNLNDLELSKMSIDDSSELKRLLAAFSEFSKVLLAEKKSQLDQIEKALRIERNLLQEDDVGTNCFHFSAMNGQLDLIPNDLLTQIPENVALQIVFCNPEDKNSF